MKLVNLLTKYHKEWPYEQAEYVVQDPGYTNKLWWSKKLVEHPPIPPYSKDNGWGTRVVCESTIPEVAEDAISAVITRLDFIVQQLWDEAPEDAQFLLLDTDLPEKKKLALFYKEDKPGEWVFKSPNNPTWMKSSSWAQDQHKFIPRPDTHEQKFENDVASWI